MTIATTSIPTQQQLRDRALMLLQKHLTAGASSAPVQTNALETGLRRETNKVLAYMQAGVAEGILQWLRDHIARQAVPINATGQWLIDWCRSYGIQPKGASRAKGLVTGSGTAGTVLTTDQVLQRADGLQYNLLAEMTVAADGTLAGDLQAIDGGIHGNTLAGSKLRLANPVPGISNEFTVDAAGLTGGADPENESELLIRLLARIQNPPHGGNPEDYAQWAMEVAGVTRAWGYRTPHGACTAGVAFLMDANDNNGIPAAADRQRVYDYIRQDDVGPPDELFVFELTAKTINITLTKLQPNTVAVQQAVSAELVDLFLRYRLPGDQIEGKTLPLSHIREAISIATGEEDHGIDLMSDITLADREVPVLGTVTFPGV